MKVRASRSRKVLSPDGSKVAVEIACNNRDVVSNSIRCERLELAESDGHILHVESGIFDHKSYRIHPG